MNISLHSSLAYSYLPMPELRGGAVWSNTFLQGRKKHDVHHFQSAMSFFLHILSATKSGHIFCTFTFQFSVVWGHPRLIHSQKARKRTSPFLYHHWQCSAANSVHASHLGCLESISIRLSSVCCGYSSLCCNRCVHLCAVVLDCGMNALHVSPVAVVGASLQEFSYVLPPNTNDVQPPRNSFIWWVISAHPFIRKHHDTFWKCSSNHEIKLHHSANLRRRETPVLFLSVHYSATVQKDDTALSHRSQRSTLLPHIA